MPTHIRTLAAGLATAAALLCFDLPAHAVGSLIDVQVIDRASGETLPMYWHNGRWWVPGKPGHRYAVALTNRAGGRALAVVSVDGVNVVSGESAAPDQTGYVLSPGQFAQITGGARTCRGLRRSSSLRLINRMPRAPDGRTTSA